MNSSVPVASRNGALDHWLLKWRARLQLVCGLKGHALVTLEQMRQRWPDDLYVLQSLAHMEAERGNLALASHHLRRLVAQQPTVAAAWFNLAFVLEQLELAAEAEEAFRKAIALDPAIDRAWYGLGLTLVRQQRLGEAVAAFQRNTEMQPMSPYGWYQMARAHADMGNRDEALRILTHLNGFEPKVAAQLRRELGMLPAPPA